MNKGISKGKSIEFLCDKWDINKENTVAFGDHYNDVEMLQTVGTPFLMENAPAELKEIITSITSSNEADGIYNGLKQIGLID
jgi:hydroxymethylpyrimidine pyrophosphatase-like HAD family hydrolase